MKKLLWLILITYVNFSNYLVYAQISKAKGSTFPQKTGGSRVETDESLEKPFLLSIEDVWTSPRGTLVTGKIERGIIRVNQEVEIVGLNPTIRTKVIGIEMFRKSLSEARSGDNVAVILNAVNSDQIFRGQVLAAPGTITAHKKFKSRIYAFTTEEGGRHSPFYSEYSPSFFFRTVDIPGTIQFQGGIGDNRTEVRPGEYADVIVELVSPIAIDEGLQFKIREASRVIGIGLVDEIIE